MRRRREFVAGLNGAKAANLPVQRVTKMQLAINLKTAKVLFRCRGSVVPTR